MKPPPFSPAPAAVATALVAGSALAFVLPVSADVSGHSPAWATSTLEVRPQVVRKAAGAALEVTFEFNCNIEMSTTLDIRVTQRIGSTVTKVQQYAWPQCTGVEQEVTVGVHAGDRPFTAESAYVQATLSPHARAWGSRHDLEVEVVDG